MKKIPLLVQWVEENTYIMTVEGASYHMRVGETRDGLELYRFANVVGFEIRTQDGLYAVDIKGSGEHVMNLVEDNSGRILDM